MPQLVRQLSIIPYALGGLLPVPTITVLDSTMYYEDAGSGTPLVFLHGNPTSSFLWRKVLPRIGEPGRRLAPDLIGMGQSGKPDSAYQFADHARYLDAWFDALALDDVVLIGHDWGGALAFDWAARHAGRVRGMAFMETIVRPMSWSDLAPVQRARLEAQRTPGVGEKLVLDENFFIEQALRATILTGLSDADLDVYRGPYPTPESRRPMLAWTRSLPYDGQPADLVRRIEAYDDWLASSPDVPKLLLTFDGSPDALLMGPDLIDWCATHIASLEIQRCGPAKHLVPEDQPEDIANALVEWMNRRHLRTTAAAASLAR